MLTIKACYCSKFLCKNGYTRVETTQTIDPIELSNFYHKNKIELALYNVDCTFSIPQI